MAEKPVHEQVQELLNRWNPPPTDESMERIVGVPTEPGDVAATSHTPMSELNRGFTDDGDDDDDDSPAEAKSYEDMTKAELQEVIDARNEDREDDAKIARTGTNAELVARLEDDDDEEEDEDE